MVPLRTDCLFEFLQLRIQGKFWTSPGQNHLGFPELHPNTLQASPGGFCAAQVVGKSGYTFKKTKVSHRSLFGPIFFTIFLAISSWRVVHTENSVMIENVDRIG